MPDIRDASATQKGQSLSISYTVRHERHEAGVWFDDVVHVIAGGTEHVQLTTLRRAPVEIVDTVDELVRVPRIEVDASWPTSLVVTIESTPRPVASADAVCLEVTR